MGNYLLAIDQGTTNSRAIIFNRDGNIVSQHEIALKQFFPKPGCVEQDPLEMFANTLVCCKQSLANANFSSKEIAAIGISNQRETTIIWEKATGKPIYPAIVWQDRRTIDICKKIVSSSIANIIPTRTGLLIDPYFSATKIMWLLDNVPNTRERAEKGELLFGTVDSFLLWKLTKGNTHATDATNAARTMLFNIHTQQWDDEILTALRIPKKILPVVLDNNADFGNLAPEFLGKSIPVASMIGDQQAATFGQACFHAGMIKATYGTGGFLLLNTGKKAIQSQHRLLSTVAYRVNKKVVYGLEGSIFSTGVTIKWLRDTLQIITTAGETEKLAQSISDMEDVYLVPAFTGLGAPYWDPAARAAILGMTRNTGRAQIARAALESVAYQTQDLLIAMQHDSHYNYSTLRVDGGMAVNNWLLQFLSDIVNLEVQRPRCTETTALGAAYLAGLQVGLYQSLDEIEKLWQINQRFSPAMPTIKRANLYAGWKQAVERIL